MFIEKNANPWGVNEEDCMIRAITLATGKDYMEVHDDMLQLAYDKDWDITELRTGWTYLVNNGYEALDFDECKCTVKQYATEMKEPRVVVVKGHMTFTEKGNIYDTWNCSKYRVKYAFRKSNSNNAY